MTTKLSWRLSKLPTVEELLQLVKDKIITQEEAKEILFSDKAETKPLEELDNLKSEIKFLRQLVEKLSNGQTTRIIETIREIEKPWKPNPWYQPYWVWCGGETTSSSFDSQLAYYASPSVIVTSSGEPFSSIKTF